MKSSDEGATWSAPKDITETTKAPNWTWVATGPGIGIQLKNGRLVIPCDHTEEKTIYNSSHIIYSDDNGESWHLGGSTIDKFLAEPQIVELADGKLLLNSRNVDSRIFFVLPFPTNSLRYRTISISTNGGLTWTMGFQDSTLIEPGPHGCQASIIRFTGDAEGDGKNRILFSNPGSKNFREKMTVRLSYNEGRTWLVSKVISPNLAGYSCLAVLKNRMIACLYEKGKVQYNEKISLAIFNLEWLTDSKDNLP